jgi:hypothetical protein
VIPLAGWAIGAGVGVRLGYLKEEGIGEDFQHQVRDHLQPSTSALFLVIERAEPTRRSQSCKSSVARSSRQLSLTPTLKSANGRYGSRRVPRSPPSRLREALRERNAGRASSGDSLLG